MIRRREAHEVARATAALERRPTARVVTVIATYRRPEMLARAVRSALDQTVTDHHVVVVDDGGGEVPLPPDPRLTVVHLERNIGVAGAVRNVGVRVSSSDVLAFLDDDNEWTPDHLERGLALLDRGVFLAYSGLVRYDTAGRQLDVLAEPFDRRLMRSRAYIDTSAIVVRRTPRVVFSRVPRNRRDFPVEDWELVWRLSRRHRVALAPDPTVRYVVHEESYFSSWLDDPNSPLVDRGDAP
jgi:glycosyltransferase involved in cell wall biosynthesis